MTNFVACNIGKQVEYIARGKMSSHTTYIHRTLQLARKGAGFTQPNPMVGAVIVHNNQIIGEGYHRKYGEAHAEVNAINSVKDTALLTKSTLYVSLEPCSHYGKTPPCAELIIASNIPRVVVATADPNPKVSGKGIQMMRDSGVEVVVGVLEDEARRLNKPFFVNHTLQRPYIVLKWAQSSDGFIDIERTSCEEKPPARLSNDITAVLAHKLRTEVQAILVGTHTALLDNPQLTARKWFGNNPTRIVIDRENKLSLDLAIFDGATPTIVFASSVPDNARKKENVTHIPVDFSKNVVEQMLQHLFERKITSLLVEGGEKTLSSFIKIGLWDEAFIEISDTPLFAGVESPVIQGVTVEASCFFGSIRNRLESKTTRNFI